MGTLLRLLDLREGRAKPADVELVFKACQTVIIRVVRLVLEESGEGQF